MRSARRVGEGPLPRTLGPAAPPTAEPLADPETSGRSRDGLPIAFPSGGYQGEYIGEIADELLREHGESLVNEPGDGLPRRAPSADLRRDPCTLDALGVAWTSTRTSGRSSKTGAAADARIAEVVGLATRRRRHLVFRATARPRAHALGRGWMGEATHRRLEITITARCSGQGRPTSLPTCRGADHADQFVCTRRRCAFIAEGPDHRRCTRPDLIADEIEQQRPRRVNYVTVDAPARERRCRRPASSAALFESFISTRPRPQRS